MSLTTAQAHALRDSIVAVIAAHGWNRIALDLDDAHLDRFRAVLPAAGALGAGVSIRVP